MKLRKRPVAAVALSVVLVSGLTACDGTGQETAPAVPVVDAAMSAPVRLGVTDDPLQRALADDYRSEFSDIGRDVEDVSLAPGERLDRLRAGEVTMVLGCVGELLDELDAAKGRELRELYRNDGGPGHADASMWRDITHSTMLSALPGDLQVGDPGMAVACDDDSLPQNTVAVYRRATMDRKDRKAIANVAGGVTTGDLRSEAGQGTGSPEK
jgi:hypothetical protein